MDENQVVEPEAEEDSCQDELDKLRREQEGTYDLLLRKQAEFENYRKRVAKEREELRLTAQAEVLERLLPTLDACQKGLESIQADSAESSQLEAYRKGYELLLKELQSVLRKFDVSEIRALGASFDPNLHEALATEVSSEHQAGQILDEFRKGYQIRHRLLRPAQVKVAVQPEEPSPPQEEEEIED